MHLYFLAKFTKHFKQDQQVKGQNKDHEDLCWPLIDTHKLIVTVPYLYLVIYKSHNRTNYPIFGLMPWKNFFLQWDLYFTKYKYLRYKVNLYVTIKGQKRSSWSLFRTFNCWTCLKHLVNLANKYKCFSIFWPSSPSVLDKFNEWTS